MTYNSNMERASLAIGADNPSRREWKAGSLAWAIATGLHIDRHRALGIAVREAMISGDYRTILTHQTLTPFITIGFAVIGALVASRHPRNPIGWIFVAVGILYALIATGGCFVHFQLPFFPDLRVGVLVRLLALDPSHPAAGDVCAAGVSGWSSPLPWLAFRGLVCRARAGADRPGGDVASRSVGKPGVWRSEPLWYPGSGAHPGYADLFRHGLLADRSSWFSGCFRCALSPLGGHRAGADEVAGVRRGNLRACFRFELGSLAHLAGLPLEAWSSTSS